MEKEKQLQPFQFVQISQEVHHVISAYKSVNDSKVIGVLQLDLIKLLDEMGIKTEAVVEKLLEIILAKDCTHERADKALQGLKSLVQPFPEMDEKQIDKLFKKQKKVQYPSNWETDRYQQTYWGWDDYGNQKKYLIMPQNQRYIGLYGDMDPKPLNGLCAICHELSTVSMFSVKLKARGASGNYTKRVNLICRNNAECNARINDPQYLNRFVDYMTNH
ncbi:fibronectin-binding protein [Weissella koreensis KACC 15510]|uniref:FusB/FusC family EF-G-binding protein n=1 Tax=Weissella koreensis TaxID=165096 RepID=UPI0002175710|nr:elongation factor G-binding protein [Weissella koreensis]AEJ23521.1 fibronectin-binding protein [Weissella koreensis KACC 15510]